MLTLVDNFSRISLAIEVDFSLSGKRVVEVLERLRFSHGLPKTIKVDNGSEFISKALDAWAYHNNVKLDFSRPGKPTDNAFIESFNGRLRQECLNQNWFTSLDDARRLIEAWREEYNHERPQAFAQTSNAKRICRALATNPDRAKSRDFNSRNCPVNGCRSNHRESNLSSGSYHGGRSGVSFCSLTSNYFCLIQITFQCEPKSDGDKSDGCICGSDALFARRSFFADGTIIVAGLSVIAGAICVL